MKPKAEKVNATRKLAEAQKAAKKAQRAAKAAVMAGSGGTAKKGKSAIPQSKTKAKK